MQRPWNLLVLTLLSGCALDDPSEPAVSTDEAEVFGNTNYNSDCTLEQRMFLDKAAQWGRIAAGSHAFEQCMERSLAGPFAFQPNVGGPPTQGPYRQCTADPYYGASSATQLARALDVARSGNDNQIACSGGAPDAFASAAIGGYDDYDAEAFSWSTLDDFMNAPRTGATPWAETAGVIWHESSHQHGYTHGGAPDWGVGCGYDGDSSYGAVNTMPYIIGYCTLGTLKWSAQTCGDMETCPTGQLKLVTGFGASTCECVGDPKVVSTRAANAITHVTSTLNTSGATTTLSSPLLDGHPEAIIQFVHTYAPSSTGGAYNGNHTIARYNAPTGRWVLENSNGVAMPIGTGFFVRIGRGGIHRTTSANIVGYETLIDHPLTNGNPNALVTASPIRDASAGAINSHQTSVFYDVARQKWAIFNDDFAAMPVNVAFSFDVDTATNRGLHFIHTANTTNRSGHMTRLSSPYLDGRPYARFLVTPDWQRGHIYDTSEFGVWYDGTNNWWIYHEAGSSSGAAMPNNEAFHIEILADETQRWVRVPESAVSVDTGIDVPSYGRISVHGAGVVYASPWSPSNPPTGDGTTAGSTFPLPGAGKFSLIGQLGPETPFAIGTNVTRAGSTAGYRRLSLRTNDDAPDGSGYFEAEVRMFRQ